MWTTSLGRPSPLPELPEIQEIRDFPELRTCNNITVRWLPSPDLRPCTYCVLISEMPKTNSDWSPIPNQCQLNVNLTRRTKFAAKYCSTETNRNTPMIRSIPHLEHGKLFTVQVTAQIGNGRVLAYQLLNVRTASKCNHDTSKWIRSR